MRWFIIDKNDARSCFGDSVEGIMTTNFTDLKSDMSVEQALLHIRKTAPEKKTLYACYITDSKERLAGFIGANDLLCAPLECRLDKIMKPCEIYVHKGTGKALAASLLAKHSFLTLPVIDHEKRIIGVLTIDNALKVLKAENEEDFSVIAGISPAKNSYFKASAFSVFKSRIPWLLLLMFTATFTGMIISAFENALTARVILSAFIPMLMGTGGNCGSQSSITLIRSLSLGEIRLSDTPYVLFKELKISLLCGACLGIFEFVKIMSIDRFLLGEGVDFSVALTVSLTLVATVFFAKIVGALLPLAASKARLDPAVMASPFITTLVDTASLLIYFSFAKAILCI